MSLDKRGKPVLVADNFEVNMHYPRGTDENRAIREAKFQFLTRYAKACNIPRVVLGEVVYNDVETQDLPSISLPPITKLGGYLWGDNEPYYLESRGKTDAYLIDLEAQKENPI